MFLDKRLQIRRLGILTFSGATYCRADCLTATLRAVQQRDPRLGQAEKHHEISTWNTAGICCSSLHLDCLPYMLHCNHDSTRCVATLSACMSTCHMHACMLPQKSENIQFRRTATSLLQASIGGFADDLFTYYAACSLAIDRRTCRLAAMPCLPQIILNSWTPQYLHATAVSPWTAFLTLVHILLNVHLLHALQLDC